MLKKKGPAYNKSGKSIKDTLTKIEKEKMRSLGQRIKQVRNKRGWTLEQIEEKGYRSMRHWQQLESGSRNISFIILLRVSKTLQISLSELFKEI